MKIILCTICADKIRTWAKGKARKTGDSQIQTCPVCGLVQDSHPITAVEIGEYEIPEADFDKYQRIRARMQEMDQDHAYEYNGPSFSHGRGTAYADGKPWVTETVVYRGVATSYETTVGIYLASARATGAKPGQHAPVNTVEIGRLVPVHYILFLQQEA